MKTKNINMLITENKENKEAFFDELIIIFICLGKLTNETLTAYDVENNVKTERLSLSKNSIVLR